MHDLPDPGSIFDHENAFYLGAPAGRIGKLLAHFEMFSLVADCAGAVVECGVFKGASFARLAAFRQLIGDPSSQPLVGFDTFGTFPATSLAADQDRLTQFIAEAGDTSIGAAQLRLLLEEKGQGTGLELVEGDICDTVPSWVEANPDTPIALLHVDVDIYEPSRVIFEHLWPRLVPGGVMILDDYGRWEGETLAFQEHFGASPPRIQRMPYIADTPVYVVKD